MQTFKELHLNDALIQNLTQAGYARPTKIQEQAIPYLLEGRDLLGIAQTGTGKTAAFSIPILQHITKTTTGNKGSFPKALIIAPTRELCSQIVDTLELYANGLNIRTIAIFGGVGQKDQVDSIKAGVDIVVATPGRLLDLVNQKILRLSAIEKLVLDEADRMLDMGFIDDIQEIIRLIPAKRQTMMFSATMPSVMNRFALELLKNPIKVQVAAQNKTSDTIEQKIIFCKNSHKFQLLKKIITQETGLFLVFTTSKINADHVVEYLKQNKIPTGAIHADKNQSERERHLANFKSKAIKVLVASDIASRGIDVEGVTHVINFDLPLSGEAYIHRIGRTARAGESGKSISFCDESELRLLDKIKRVLKQEIASEKFEGKFEELKLNLSREKKKRAPTSGKSQEKTAYLDHSKRQRVVEGKPSHPGFRKTKKKKKR